jgi:agmatine deiminase
MTGAERRPSTLVNEGGGIAVNGGGDVLLTETVQLDPGRNPTASKTSVEQEVHGQLGTERAVWFERGLWRDYQNHGTRGHVDIVAAFVPDGSVLLHRQFDTSHPDSTLWPRHCQALEQAGFKVRALPAPRVARDNVDWVDYSYVNHYVGNGFVLLPAFRDRTDEHALEILKDLYPDRHVTNLDARVLFAMGGGIHCITQQQPLVV